MYTKNIIFFNSCKILTTLQAYFMHETQNLENKEVFYVLNSTNDYEYFFLYFYNMQTFIIYFVTVFVLSLFNH